MHPRSSGSNMSEASPYYSIDITKMRNPLLQSVSSQLDSHENKVQLEICEGSMQMNNLIGFNMESRLFNNDNQLGKRVYTQSSQAQSLIYDKNHQPGSLYVISGWNDISQQSLLLDKDPSLSQYEGVSGNARKRPFEYSGNMSLRKTMKNNSKSKITFVEPKRHQTKKASEITPRHQLCVPTRRKHKLSEKVIVLQKLVSPFGKTDTASVLHEAALYIKLIQSQIRTLFQMLSFSYITTTEAPHKQAYGDRLQVDLRSRGLCLVPISITQTVTMEDQIHRASASRIILPRNL